MNELHVFYSHNPLTYTINQLILSHLKPTPHHRINARGIQTPGATTVVDDGVWNISRNVEFLKSLVAIPNFEIHDLHLYLPHTGYLLGKLVKISKKITHYSYVEEGQYSIDHCHHHLSDKKVDTDQLLQALRAEHLLESLKLDAHEVLNLNQISNCFYDAQHAKYHGSYCISDQAFKSFNNTKQFEIHAVSIRDIHFAQHALVVLPPLYSSMVQTPMQWTKIMTALTHCVMEYKKEVDLNLVIKLHPQDVFPNQSNDLFKKFIAIISELGILFHQYPWPEDFDFNLELAFLGFAKYLVIGSSSAAMHLKKHVSKDDFKVID